VENITQKDVSNISTCICHTPVHKIPNSYVYYAYHFTNGIPAKHITLSPYMSRKTLTYGLE
jgi:hypothetical protein